MKKSFVGLVVAFSVLIIGMGLASDKNPADYTQNAHVLGAARHQTPDGTTSGYGSSPNGTAYRQYGLYRAGHPKGSGLVRVIFGTLQSFINEVDRRA